MEKVSKEHIKTGFRVIGRYLKEYKRETIVLSFLGLVSAFGNGAVPYIAGKFFDSIITPASATILGNTFPLYLVLLVIWASVQLVSYVVDWASQIRSENFSNKLWTHYLAFGFSALLEFPMSFHKKQKIGAVGDKINRAAGRLETIVGRIIIDLSPQILSIVVALVIGFNIQPLLAVLLIVGVSIYMVILAYSVKPLAAMQKEYYDVMNQSWGDMYEAVGNVQPIKQAVTEEYESKKLFGGLMGKVLPLWIAQNKVWSNLNLYQRATILLTQIAIFAFSIHYIHVGSMTLGGLLAFNAYAAMIFGPFVTLGRQWQTIQNGLIDLAEAEIILATPKEDYVPNPSAPLAEVKGEIEFKNVSFRYDEGRPVLENISFHAHPGEIIALVGESGVGKTTLVDLISGYHFPSSGEVRIDGYGIKIINLRFLRSNIAVVPQEVVLFNDTIKTNIKYGNFEATDKELREAAKKAHALDFIEKFTDKWEQLVGERGVKLSVGQKQRVAIARAILRNPKILILDEPTSALDAGSEQIITASLEELMRGKTTFIIAHRLSTVRKADKILVFKEGKLIEQGKHDELLKIKDGEYRRLYELQIGLHQ